MGKVVLEAQNISKSYSYGKKKLVVLKNLSLKVCEGEIVTIIGESGCGKSTALNILSSLDYPDTGILKIDSKKVNYFENKLISKLRNEEIGYVFQSAYLLPEFTALENVLMPTWISNRDNIENEALDIFKDLGIIDRKNHYPYQLSGGEKARVSIIRAIINKPKILFADEPTGNLDKHNSKKLLVLLKKLNKVYKQTMVLTTHDPFVASFGYKTFKLENGFLQ